MRISSLKNDPGYQAFVRNVMMGERDVRIFLDNVEQDGVVTADDAQGLIVREKRDENGRLVSRDDCVVTEDIYGDVRIEIGGRIP